MGSFGNFLFRAEADSGVRKSEHVDSDARNKEWWVEIAARLMLKLFCSFSIFPFSLFLAFIYSIAVNGVCDHGDRQDACPAVH